MGKPATLKVDIITDASQTSSELDSVSSKFDATSSHMDDTGSKAEAMAGHFDETATKTSTVAGALGDLGGALEMAGGPLAPLGRGMTMIQPAIMGIAGASDLATVATEKLRLGQLKSAAATALAKAKSIALAAATKVMAAAQWLMNAAMSANPIGLVVIALVALTAAFVIAYKKSETFRRIVKGALDAVKKVFTALGNAAGAAWSAIKTAFTKAMSWFKSSPIATVIFAPFKAAYDLISGGPAKLYADFKKVPAGIARALVGTAKAITGPFSDAWSTIKGVWDGVAQWFRDKVTGPIKDAFDAAIGWVRDIWNGFATGWNAVQITLPKIHIPLNGDVGGNTIGLPDLPKMGEGGFVPRATLAMIGEAGPEIVSPLPMLRKILRDELGGGGVHITVNGALDADAVARQIEAILRGRARRVGGPRLVGTGAL